MTAKEVGLKGNRILVTGTGGGVGQSLLKALHGSGYGVIAADGDVLAAGLFAAERGYRIPYASDPGFVDALLAICSSQGCALVFPGLDAELPVLASNRQRFEDAGVTCVVSDPAVIQICDDKLETSRFLKRHGLPAPRTCAASDRSAWGDVGFPMVLKPRRGGRRSIGVRVVREASEAEVFLAGVDPRNYVAQEYIEGDEYTCGTVTVAGHCEGVISMRRILRDGDTHKAFVETVPSIDDLVRSAAEALKPFGACNFQLRVRSGVPIVFEINARSSGTTHSRALAGFNEPRAIADYLIKGRKPLFEVREVTILRYWSELVVSPERVARLERDGHIESDGSRLFRAAEDCPPPDGPSEP